MVLMILLSLDDIRIKHVLSGGSSSILRRALAASLFGKLSFSASKIITTLYLSSVLDR